MEQWDFETKWYAIQVRSRFEFATANILHSKGFEPFVPRGNMQPAATLTIENASGNIDLVGTAGGQFRITAIKRTKPADIHRISFEVNQQETGPKVRSFYTGGSTVRNAHVHFIVEIPSSAAFIGHTANGHIKVSNVANVEVESKNGSILITGVRFASAQTRNGQIDVSLRDHKWAGALQFSALNGGIRVQLPDQASAEVEASTLNGTVSTDFPLSVVKHLTRNCLHGRIGGEVDGGHLICKTSNGHVHLARAVSAS